MKHPADSTTADRTTSAKRRRTSSFRQRHSLEPRRPAVLADLPETVLLQVFKWLGLDRLTALQVCRRWRLVAEAPCFTHKVKHGHGRGAITAAVERARPGDTVTIAPGFYMETLLIDKPLRLVGLPAQDIWGRPRRGVVLQTGRPLAIMCNARVCLEGLTLRTVQSTGDRSVVSFGPACNYIRLERCEVGGFCGLILPLAKQEDNPKLVMLGCEVHGIQDESAIIIEAGLLRMQGCVVTNCQVALNVQDGAEVDLRHNSISFNEVALVGGGHGCIQHCQFWGNLHRSTIHLSEGALAASQLGGIDAAAAAAAEGPAPVQAGTAAAGIAPDQAAGEQGDAAGARAGPVTGAEAGGDEGGEGEGEDGRAGARRRSAAAAPKLTFTGNHVANYSRGRERGATLPGIRQKARDLAREVYGRHEGVWQDHGEDGGPGEGGGPFDSDTDSEGSDGHGGSDGDEGGEDLAWALDDGGDSSDDDDNDGEWMAEFMGAHGGSDDDSEGFSDSGSSTSSGESSGATSELGSGVNFGTDDDDDGDDFGGAAEQGDGDGNDDEGGVGAAGNGVEALHEHMNQMLAEAAEQHALAANHGGNVEVMGQIYQNVQAMHETLSAMLATLAQAQAEAEQQGAGPAGSADGDAPGA
ncbi:hypothetical protein WJX81_004067 [Elliptochloris bilobata]|uniref:F-box domain-containing protein n=1 Tax=Elliptochloris bilobata TaxID=381761 RepID=A0AAW1SJ33_9CHLO